jgi:hypothetical protein
MCIQKITVKIYNRKLHKLLIPNKKQARLSIEITNEPKPSYYNDATDEIFLSITKEDVKNHKPDYTYIYFPWKSQLIHEFIHEYQYKIKPQITDAAIVLSTKKHFVDKGHGYDFYQSVIEVAKKLKIDVMGLLKEI